MYEKFETMGETSMVMCQNFVYETPYYEIVREWSCGYPADIAPSTGIPHLDAGERFRSLLYDVMDVCEGYFNGLGADVEHILWCFHYL